MITLQHESKVSLESGDTLWDFFTEHSEILKHLLWQTRNSYQNLRLLDFALQSFNHNAAEISQLLGCFRWMVLISSLSCNPKLSSGRILERTIQDKHYIALLITCTYRHVHQQDHVTGESQVFPFEFPNHWDIEFFDNETIEHFFISFFFIKDHPSIKNCTNE